MAVAPARLVVMGLIREGNASRHLLDEQGAAALSRSRLQVVGCASGPDGREARLLEGVADRRRRRTPAGAVLMPRWPLVRPWCMAPLLRPGQLTFNAAKSSWTPPPPAGTP